MKVGDLMFNEYPYINLQDLNLDYILMIIKKIRSDLNDFVNLNTIKYADPINWDITRQYETNTIVVDPYDGTAYISVRPIPVGVSITNTEYWTPIFNYGNAIENIKSNIASNELHSTTATRAYTKDSLVWFNDDLYITLNDISIGTAFIINDNIRLCTAEDFIKLLIANLKDYVDQQNNDLKDYVDQRDNDLKDYVDQQDNDLKDYVDQQDNDIKDMFYFVTPQMYGAVGDGVTDDTAAFVTLSNVIDKDIIIPTGTYLITDNVTLSNVKEDYGTYIDYVPMYPHNTILKISNMSLANKNVPLPSNYEYEECVIYHDNKYYALTNKYNDSEFSVCIYDDNLNLISSTSYADPQTDAPPFSITTDGTYAWVDYRYKIHRKYYLSNFSTPLLETEGEYIFTCYYNHALYGVEYDSGNIIIGTLNDNLDTLSNTWSFSVPEWLNSWVVQSATTYKGQIILSTTIGYFYVIDLVSHNVNMTYYNDESLEIESIFEKDGELIIDGHRVFEGGVFNLFTLNGGVNDMTTKYVPVDGNTSLLQFQDRAPRPNFYVVTHGTAAGLPLNDCVVAWLSNNLFAFSSADNAIYTMRNNTWYLTGRFRQYNEVIDGSHIMLIVRPDGQLYLRLNKRLQYAGNSGSISFSADLSIIYGYMNFSDTQTAYTLILGEPYGSFTDMTKDVCAIEVLMTKTGITFNIRNLTSSNNIDTVVIGDYLLKLS